jgi:hypothetical protein
MRRYLSALVIVAVSGSAGADEPPSWSEFSIKSANSRFEAAITVLDHGNRSRPWENQYRIRVQSTGRNGSYRQIWEGPYDYDGYAGGLLSNDGAYFVYVDYWYRHMGPAVRIYRYGALCFFTGQQLGMKDEGLQKTVSHRLWLSGQPKFVELQGRSVAVLVPTVQGEKRVELAAEVTFNGIVCTNRKR